MVWPSKARDRDFDAVSESYALAAQDVVGTLLPAGDAWREAWRRDPSLALYADDGFHPSGLGSYLAALTIWRGLAAQSAIGLPGPPGVVRDDAQGCCRNQPITQLSGVRGRRNSPALDD